MIGSGFGCVVFKVLRIGVFELCFKRLLVLNEYLSEVVTRVTACIVFSSMHDTWGHLGYSLCWICHTKNGGSYLNIHKVQISMYIYDRNRLDYNPIIWFIKILPGPGKIIYWVKHLFVEVWGLEFWFPRTLAKIRHPEIPVLRAVTGPRKKMAS